MTLDEWLEKMKDQPLAPKSPWVDYVVDGHGKYHDVNDVESYKDDPKASMRAKEWYGREIG